MEKNTGSQGFFSVRKSGKTIKLIQKMEMGSVISLRKNRTNCGISIALIQCSLKAYNVH